MEFIWHQTDWGHSRVLEARPPHTLGDWVVFHPVGAGGGVVHVDKGVSTTPPPEILAILRVEGVWRVIADPNGYFIITITEDRLKYWTQIEALVIQAIIEAQEKANGAG